MVGSAEKGQKIWAAMTSMERSRILRRAVEILRERNDELAALQKALDTAQEPAAWDALARARQRALLAAGLPTWIATLAVFVGLEGVPLLLLVLSTLVLFYLYRIPRQVG